ncbi:hypothetical protein KR100_11845 [Synechococcus sp. KORDI-100]|nr:hypothetical protein KR100_11845 [Synechococcus sp. KORDI-100]
MLGGETQQISGHAHLAITVVASPDPDHGDRQLTPDLAGKVSWDVFQNQGETARLFQLQRL